MYILKVIEKKICFQKSYQNYGMWQICYFTSRIKYDNYAKFCTVLKNLQYDYFWAGKSKYAQSSSHS